MYTFKIYKAENKINGDCYIGKTIRDLDVRKKRHIYDAKNNSNYIFHRALIKYGIENFEWTVICTTDNYNKLNKLEIFYIEIYSKITKIYNISKGGDGVLGVEISAETKKKLSDSWKKNPKIFYGEKNPRFGAVVEESTRIKISKANKGKISWNKGIPCREETKKKLSEKAKLRPGVWTGKKRILSQEHKDKMSESQKIRRLKEFKEKKFMENINV